MSEMIRQQLSAFIDNELSASESALLLRRLTEDPDLGRCAAEYHLIGSILRSERVVGQGFVAQVARRLDNEPAYEQRSASASPKLNLRSLNLGVVKKLVAGGAIAATVATVAVLQLQRPAAVNGDPVLTNNAVTPVAVLTPDATVADAYTVPSADAQDVRGMPQPRMVNYLMRHGQVASRLGRSGMNSRIISYGLNSRSVAAENAIDDVTATRASDEDPSK